jgi:hypothetical protein
MNLRPQHFLLRADFPVPDSSREPATACLQGEQAACQGFRCPATGRAGIRGTEPPQEASGQTGRPPPL